ncbi:MAG: Nudix family hydrolase [Nitrococcus mobilis]|nr:Nudix family hydrolase [Nitrococcus mobilis]
MHVAVGVVTDVAARVLICRRGVHRHQGGLWEFPGGKVEPGEDACAALGRELAEEVGIRPEQAWPLIRVPYHYPDKEVLLDVWRVPRFTGVAHGREGQCCQWVMPSGLAGFCFPPANHPIVLAAGLPARYLITPPLTDPDGLLKGVLQSLRFGCELVQLRTDGLSGVQLEKLAHRLLAAVRAAGGRLLVSRRLDIARRVGTDGVHLSAAQLWALRARPLPTSRLVGASCHGPEDLARACAIGVDFAVLSPVRATPSHSDREPLGWRTFAAWIRDVSLPVYALGGVGPADMERAWRARAQGVAGIRGFWHAGY